MTAHFGKIILEKDNYKIIFCENCKFIHVDPLPNESDLLTFYRDDFYDSKHSQYIQKYSDEIDYWNLVYDERLENIEKLHNLFPLKLLYVISDLLRIIVMDGKLIFSSIFASIV